jgi:hypothetical protein
MNKEDFIKLIEELGFTKTWDESNEWSIFPDGHGLFQPKISINFTVENEEDCIRLYHSKVTNSVSMGSNLGFFPIESIGDFERLIIFETLSEYCPEIGDKFRSIIRDNRLDQIL